MSRPSTHEVCCDCCGAVVVVANRTDLPMDWAAVPEVDRVAHYCGTCDDRLAGQKELARLLLEQQEAADA